MNATLILKAEGLAKIRRWSGIATDSELAARIGVDPATVHRVLTGKSAPGPKFIAGLLAEFGTDAFQDLFEVAPDDHPHPAA